LSVSKLLTERRTNDCTVHDVARVRSPCLLCYGRSRKEGKVRTVDPDEACRNLYIAVLQQAKEDLDSEDDNVRENAEAFFMDWRLDALCKAAGMDARSVAALVKRREAQCT